MPAAHAVKSSAIGLRTRSAEKRCKYRRGRPGAGGWPVTHYRIKRAATAHRHAISRTSKRHFIFIAHLHAAGIARTATAARPLAIDSSRVLDNPRSATSARTGRRCDTTAHAAGAVHDPAPARAPAPPGQRRSSPRPGYPGSQSGCDGASSRIDRAQIEALSACFVTCQQVLVRRPFVGASARVLPLGQRPVHRIGNHRQRELRHMPFEPLRVPRVTPPRAARG